MSNKSIKQRVVKKTIKQHTETEIVTFRVPDEIISLLDRLVEKKLFNSRSEAIREFCREYVIENRGVLE